MLDYIYSRPDAMWTEMGMLTKLHYLWLNWLVEYEDGSLEGGYAWNGRPGIGFAAAHHYVDGVSTARSDAVITTSRTARGSIERVRADARRRPRARARAAWRVRLAAAHLRHRRLDLEPEKRIAKSWNYTEFFPLNWHAVADYQAAHHRPLRPLSVVPAADGRARRIEDDLLVYADRD